MKSILERSDLPKDGFVVLYFYSTWMNFQNKLLKLISSYEETYPHTILGIDVDLHKDICRFYSVKCVPTFVVIKDDRVVDRFSGYILMKPFKKFFSDVFKDNS